MLNKTIKKLCMLVAMLSMATSVYAQSTACTEIGCQSGVTVQVPQVRFRSDGNYQYSIQLDKKKPIICKGSLPLRPCDEKAIHCSGSGVSIMEEGCALPMGEQHFGDIHISKQPKSLRIIVKKDGKMIGDQTWKPSYSTAQPNGTQCKPSCRQATVQMKVN